MSLLSTFDIVYLLVLGVVLLIITISDKNFTILEINRMHITAIIVGILLIIYVFASLSTVVTQFSYPINTYVCEEAVGQIFCINNVE